MVEHEKEKVKKKRKLNLKNLLRTNTRNVVRQCSETDTVRIHSILSSNKTLLFVKKHEKLTFKILQQ